MRNGIDDEESNVLIVQMANEWSKEHLEKSRDEVTELILQELQSVSQEWLETAAFHAHRWRFSRPVSQPHPSMRIESRSQEMRGQSQSGL